MRHRGSRKRRGGITEPFPLAQEPIPRVLCDESDSPAEPLLNDGEGEALPLTYREDDSFPLIHGEVDFEPVADEGNPIDPLNNEPMA